jgi:hypothetical protein
MEETVVSPEATPMVKTVRLPPMRCPACEEGA